MPRELPHYTGVYGTLETLKFYVASPPKQEDVSIIESYGRIVAEDIVSPADLPPLPRSSVDGFAVRTEEIVSASASAPVRLAIVKRGKTGGRRRKTDPQLARPIGAGETLPPGTDTVLSAEDVTVSSDSIFVADARPPGALVDQVGAEAKKGEKLLRKGTVLRAQDVGLLASVGLRRVKVFQTPRIAILPTVNDGSDGVLQATSGVIALLVAGAGGTSLVLDAVPGDPIPMLASLKRALNDADFAILISDPSETQPDPVETVLNSFGKPGLVVHGVRIEPGRTMGFGMAQGKPVVISPRSMQDAVSSFVVFTFPLIRTMSGQPFAEPPEVIADLSEDWQTAKRFQDFTKVVYVNLWTGSEGFAARPLEASPTRTTIPTAANGYVVVPESLTGLRKGTKVWAHLLPGFSYAEARFL